MLSLGFVVLFSFTVVTAVSIQAKLQSGLCLCLEENDVYARTDPGGDNPIAGVLAKGHCLVSKGGLRHVKGHTWYEVKLVDGTGTWVDGHDLRAVEMTVCTNPTTTTSTITSKTAVPTQGTTPFDPFAGGLDFCFTDNGLIGDGLQATQNGVVCTCHAGNLECPS